MRKTFLLLTVLGTALCAVAQKKVEIRRNQVGMTPQQEKVIVVEGMNPKGKLRVTTPDGRVEPSADEKIERGKKAIAALAAYRQAKFHSSDDGETAAAHLAVLNENMKYFGYGYIRDKSELVPFIPINFWAFRIMVGIGCLFILFFAVMLAVAYKFPKALFGKYDITALPAWHYWLAVALIPLAYVASESGWLVAEFGRQPWTIQDMLPTWAAVSDLQSSSVMITFFLFLVLFTTMLAVEINILLKQIKKGPEYSGM